MKPLSYVALILCSGLSCSAGAAGLDTDAVIGGGIGGAAGAAVGSVVAGRDGAIIGAAVGGGAGAAIATSDSATKVTGVKERVVYEDDDHHDHGLHRGHHKHKHKH